MYKKIMIIAIIAVAICLFIFKPNKKTDEVNAEQTLTNRIIVIDPGHGGLDNGANVGKVREDQLNLKISLALKEELESRGATVYLTRDDDNDLTHRDYNYSKQDDMYLRVRKIDSYNADLFISIHLNASTVSSTWGSQVFYYGKSDTAKELATDIHDAMKPVTGTRKKIESANFYVLRCTKTKGVLVECGFLTNGNEKGQLASSKYHKKLAVAISDGIETNLAKVPPVTPEPTEPVEPLS